MDCIFHFMVCLIFNIFIELLNEDYDNKTYFPMEWVDAISKMLTGMFLSGLSASLNLTEKSGIKVLKLIAISFVYISIFSILHKLIEWIETI